MARILDATPMYLVAVEHTEYEKSLYVFQTLDAAEQEFNRQKANHVEAYLAKIMQYTEV